VVKSCVLIVLDIGLSRYFILFDLGFPRVFIGADGKPWLCERYR
jgi:hypothetical protein